MKSMGAHFSNALKLLDLKIGHKDISPSEEL